jgi:hypothetical protein
MLEDNSSSTVYELTNEQLAGIKKAEKEIEEGNLLQMQLLRR